MEKRIMCTGAGCHMCRKRKTVEKDSSGKKLYTCEVKPDKHKKVFASDCNAFCCNDSRWYFCRDCEKK